jgi:hypothetical protein
MRKQDRFRAGFGEEPDCGQGGLEARIVGDFPVLHRHVEVDADERSLALEVSALERAEGHVSVLVP